MAHRIDKKLCTACGTCQAICPMKIFRSNGKGSPQIIDEVKRLCITCGQCMAVCPSKAIFVKGFSYEKDFIALPEKISDAEGFAGLLATRRSVRAFEDRPVPREMLEEIISHISLAPIGAPPHRVEITVVEKRETIEKALALMTSNTKVMTMVLSNRVALAMARFAMKRTMTLEEFNTSYHYLLPRMKALMPYSEASGEDFVTWGAPALLLFHADRGAECHTENIYIDLAYGILSAHAMGLGAAPIGVVPRSIRMMPKMKKIFEIPEGNDVLASMIVGYPKYTYQRTIKREMAAVRWV